ncbi:MULTISPECIES: DUF4907 domain-containing protein [Niastella]|uniref:DUF4907 domain-containing protein n=1 Tax=Niastella soli TaxID=2821487 RepID=A0ABS3Z2U5_9BACT|nr:DUF4907 domain-containing protein [Niastella soli]MBO9204484.1 DUF4907 domain-containing protein [Niastella soli]
MKKLVTLVICVGLFYAVSASKILPKPAALYASVPPANVDSTPEGQKYSYQVIKLTNNSFGYDIYSGAKKMIHQETIPGQPGSNGFTTAAAAGKVAGLVVSKLQKNIFPPTVSTEELKQLHVL